MQTNTPQLTGIKYVAFDFCGTLAELKPGSNELIRSFVRDCYGLELSDIAVTSALQKTAKEMPYSSVKIDTEELRSSYYREFNTRVLEDLGCVPAKPNELYDYFRAHKRHWIMKSEVPHLIETLKARGYSLVLASNFDDHLDKLLLKLGCHESFDRLFVSAAIGLEKPTTEFYEFIVGELKCAPQEIVMVGDDLSLDVHPSIACGFNSIHLEANETNSGLTVTAISIGQYIKIRNLSNLLDVLR